MTQFADDNQTITIQAASDSVMTVDNAGGAALSEDDCRKMYGLPHTWIGSVANLGVQQATQEAESGFFSTAIKALSDVIEASKLGYLGGGGNSSSDQTEKNIVQAAGGVFYNVVNDSWALLTGVLNNGLVDQHKSLRWDLIDAHSPLQKDNTLKTRDSVGAAFYGGSSDRVTAGYGAGDVGITGLKGYQGNSPTNVERRPTTTPFTLRCTSIQHQVDDQGSITPLMGIDWGTSGESGQPEQLDNYSFNFGFRRETINLQGVLIDNGPITAANPRRQTLLTIARTQYLKIRNTSPIASSGANESDSKDKSGDSTTELQPGVETAWGGLFAGPLNPRSYPCLTIFNRGYDTYTAGDATNVANGVGFEGHVEPDGAYRIYRGLIKNLTFSMEAGRPDYWTWQMSFEVVANEKRAVTGLQDLNRGLSGSFTVDSGNK